MKIKWKFVPLCAPRHKYVRTHTHTFTLHANSIRSERQPSVPNACWPNLIHTFGREKNGVRIHTALAYTHRPISSWFRNRYWYLLRHTNAINRIYLRQHSVSLPKNKIARLNQIIMRFITWMIFPWLWCLRSEQSVRVRCVQSPRARSGIFFSSFFQICKYAQLYIEHAYSRIHTNTHHTLTSSLLHSCASDNVCVCVSEWMCDTVEAHADILQHISCQLWFFCSSHLSHVWVTSVRVCWRETHGKRQTKGAHHSMRLYACSNAQRFRVSNVLYKEIFPIGSVREEPLKMAIQYNSKTKVKFIIAAKRKNNNKLTRKN